MRAHSPFAVPDVHVITLEAWTAAPQQEMDALRQHLGSTRLAVRSNCSKEDTLESSGAGAYSSCLDVRPDDAELTDAINTVFASYGELAELDPKESVFVQPMVEDIRSSGVILTKALPDWAPYYVVNYDDESGRTDTVTGGTGASKTVFVYNNAQPEHYISKQVRSFVEFARSVEELCGSDALDIEFALDNDGTIHLLQVRPIAARPHQDTEARDRIHTKIEHIKNNLSQRMQPHPHLYGQSTILGVMPDWNPAEMLGVTPRPLASSLYRELITRRTWSLAREQMGYRTMPPEELMTLIAGRPYIDVRCSLNSFLPSGLDPVVGEKLVSAWLKRLKDNPVLHDKIEFGVAQTVLDFTFDDHLDTRYPGLLTDDMREHYRRRLHHLTQSNLDLSEGGTLATAEARIKQLQANQFARQSEEAQGNLEAHIRHLTEECRTLGTQPFSVLARHGFIAEALLSSAVRRQALEQHRLREFKASIETISSHLGHDFKATLDGSMSRAAFLRTYGHLRPSSYDILSRCYADRTDLFDTTSSPVRERTHSDFTLTGKERAALNALITEAKLDAITPDGLLEYASRAIAGREFGKFVFTRSLSEILEHIAAWGASLGLDREALSYLTLDHIIDRSETNMVTSMTDHITAAVEQGKAISELGRGLRLGYLIRSAGDLYVIPQHRSAPNFIGREQVEATVVELSSHSRCDVDLSGKIVCIENADPGFDWIFTREIAGLVTRFGGANSHMAIRCAEYGLPAAIGVGDRLYETIRAVSRCLLNPGNNTLIPL